MDDTRISNVISSRIVRKKLSTSSIDVLQMFAEFYYPHLHINKWISDN